MPSHTAKMASRMEEVGVTKAELGTWTMFALAVLAGAFIGTRAVSCTVVTTGLGAAGMGYGVIKLLGGLVFCLGLIAVVVAGAELFTGHNLIIMAFASGRVRAQYRQHVLYPHRLVHQELAAGDYWQRH
jgi:formate transporter